MKEEMFDKITLVVPTYDNRYPSLFGLLKYYSSYGFPMKVIVVDSSSKDFSHAGLHELLDHERVSYQKVDPDLVFWPKMDVAVQSVSTPYCVFCGDEDFITPKGIYQAAKFLEENPDYTAAQGYYINFSVEDDMSGNLVFRANPFGDDPCQSIVMPEPQRRLYFHFSAYCPSFYAVHRTEFKKMILAENIKYGVVDNIFGELLPSLLTAIHGKIKFLDVLYSARRISDKWTPTVSLYVNDGTFDRRYARFKHGVAEHLVEASKLNVTEANNLIDTVFEVYYRLYCKRDEELKSKYDQIHRQLPEAKPDDMFGKIVHDPTHHYYSDFKRIRRHVLYHHDIEDPVEVLTACRQD